MSTSYVVQRESPTHAVTASAVVITDLTGAALAQDDVVTVVPQDVTPHTPAKSRKES